MVTSLTTILLSILAFPVLAIAWAALNWVWIRPRKLERMLRLQGFSGNPYSLFSGDQGKSVLMLGQSLSRPSSVTDDIKDRVIPFLNQIVKTHGKNSFVWEGPRPRVNIMDPSHVKEVLSNMQDYQKIDPHPLFKILLGGLVDHEGDTWEMHRKILNPAFQVGKLKLMLPAFHSSINQLVGKWEEMLSFKESSEVDVWPCLQDMTRDVISQTAFGFSYEQGRKLFKLQDEQIILALTAVQSVYLPGWRFVPTKLNRRMKKLEAEIRSLILDQIHRKEKAIKARESACDDLLGLMIESNLKEIQEHGQSGKKVGMSMDEVIEECKLFYISGQETTSTLLVWTMVLLSIHPEWQQRAREEVVQVFGNSQPNFDQLNHLNVITMILNEVMRLYSPIITVYRKVAKDMKLGDVTLPKGAQLLLPTILIHHDRELWGEDAMEFKPERFAEGVAKATKNRAIFFPFGWGPRICIGMNFALVEAKLALVAILQKFSFELSPNYVHAPMPMVTLQPQHGAHLILGKCQS